MINRPVPARSPRRVPAPSARIGQPVSWESSCRARALSWRSAKACGPTTIAPRSVRGRRPATTAGVSVGWTCPAAGKVVKASRSRPGGAWKPFSGWEGGRGSRKGRLRCTGPARGPWARCQASTRSWRQWRRSSSPVPGTAASAAQTGKAPKRPFWGMVCPEWHSRSSGGRSAVSTSSGVAERRASTTAGR